MSGDGLRQRDYLCRHLTDSIIMGSQLTMKSESTVRASGLLYSIARIVQLLKF